MAFFNKKEEVISLELTKYGKEAFASGKFAPEFYCFYDNDIIYDAGATGVDIEQNDVEERIASDIPSIKENFNFFESSLSKLSKIAIDRNNSFIGLPIGTSDPLNPYFPAWDIKIRNAAIKNCVPVVSKDVQPYNYIGDNPIPQINIDDVYLDIVIDKSYADEKINTAAGEFLQLGPKPDKSFVKSLENYILLEITEENGIDIGDNFDIEFLSVEKTAVGTQLLNLNTYDKINKFPTNKVVDGILMDELDIPTRDVQDIMNKDVKELSKYFNVQVDEEIPEELKVERLYLYSGQFNNQEDC